LTFGGSRRLHHLTCAFGVRVLRCLRRHDTRSGRARYGLPHSPCPGTQGHRCRTAVPRSRRNSLRGDPVRLTHG
jgi:hypothetical protein